MSETVSKPAKQSQGKMPLFLKDKRFYGLVLGFLGAVLLFLIPLDSDNPTVGKGAAVAWFIAIFWVFEVCLYALILCCTHTASVHAV
ncbi:hypothetical protein KIPB_006235 [Kipferlia bialata]|uniref:Uncharacterized protein n=1 Tax=Kipferlia bialata TaxID=797122 RepID=A0A391NPL3_9EUKA|nr:hypothetical protein KIPB_006235 [Kipferlia bialata]|eukprot:g6235.t1